MQAQTQLPTVKVERIVNLNAVGVNASSAMSSLPCLFTVTCA